ncbi:hypothetical protein GCM10007877_17140 [Marinibactrum halimedae]|uniref:Alpha/beta hydrolase n=2 Tax=Marinibactrum halimedae TaxID=1444977 RepID=A0AA37WLI5_9GAMM|nr:hypothetical protein GCM10007877_17140 [Marinibactrum halimedae]
MMALDSGNPIYERYFLKKWKKSLSIKQSLFPHLELNQAQSFRRLTELNHYLIPKHTPFASVEDYFEAYRIGDNAAKHIQGATHIISSDNDPITQLQDLKKVRWPEHVRLVVTRGGAHCAFLDKLSFTSWVDRYITQLILETND